MKRNFFGCDLTTWVLVLAILTFVAVPGYLYFEAMLTGSDL